MSKSEYLLSCVSGSEDFVKNLLERDLLNLKVIRKEEGMLNIATQSSEKKISSLMYLNNSFKVIKKYQGGTIDKFLHDACKKSGWVNTARNFSKVSKEFRLFLSDENQLVSGNSKVRGKFIDVIQDSCRIRYSPKGGGLEFWVIRRRSGLILLCVRLSRRRYTEKNLMPGELKPELSEILYELSEPTSNDIFLDPFSGSGSIIKARVKHPYNLAFGFDLDEDKVHMFKSVIKELKKRRLDKGGPIICRVEDAGNLASIDDCFIDRIVTDPPWGLYQKTEMDYFSFYLKIVSEFSRVIKPKGCLVMLLGRTDPAEKIMQLKHDGFIFEKRMDILVSGKKASIGKWKRV